MAPSGLLVRVQGKKSIGRSVVAAANLSNERRQNLCITISHDRQESRIWGVWSTNLEINVVVVYDEHVYILGSLTGRVRVGGLQGRTGGTEINGRIWATRRCQSGRCRQGGL